MKTFYLATGAIPNGYATKAAAEATKDEAARKVNKQKDGLFISHYTKYLTNHAPEDAAFIEKQFDLQQMSKTLKVGSSKQSIRTRICSNGD